MTPAGPTVSVLTGARVLAWVLKNEPKTIQSAAPSTTVPDAFTGPRRNCEPSSDMSRSSVKL